MSNYWLCSRVLDSFKLLARGREFVTCHMDKRKHEIVFKRRRSLLGVNLLLSLVSDKTVK